MTTEAAESMKNDASLLAGQQAVAAIENVAFSCPVSVHQQLTCLYISTRRHDRSYDLEPLSHISSLSIKWRLHYLYAEINSLSLWKINICIAVLTF